MTTASTFSVGPGAELSRAVPAPARAQAGTTPEHIDGLGCWCRPYRDTIEPNLIIHRQVARA